MLKVLHHTTVGYLYTDCPHVERRTKSYTESCSKRKVIWVNGVIPNFYQADRSLLLGIRNRVSHVFGILDIERSRKDLNERMREWKSDEDNRRILKEYNDSNQTVEIVGRSAYRTRFLKEHVVVRDNVCEFSFLDVVSERFNRELLKKGIKEEAVRSVCITAVYCLLETIFFEAQGALLIVQRMIKALANGVIKGYIKDTVALGVVTELMAECILIAFRGSIPLFARNVVKGGLKSSLRIVVCVINKRELALLYPEDVGLEAIKGAIRGAFKDICIWFTAALSMGIVLETVISFILGPIVATGLINIFITPALE